MFRLILFGGASLQREGATLTGRVAQRRRLALLAILGGSGGRPVSREKLVAILWPESDAARARHSLSATVYVIRKALGEDALLTEGDDLRLDPAVVACDVAEFEAARRAGELEQALDLYRGPFLDGFFIGGDAVEFETWAAAERERLERGYLDTLERLAEKANREGYPRKAVTWWHWLRAEVPDSSRAVVGLMTALAATGDRAAALRAAEEHATHLRNEYGAEPDATVTAYARRLQEVAVPWRVRGVSEPIPRAEGDLEQPTDLPGTPEVLRTSFRPIPAFAWASVLLLVILAAVYAWRSSPSRDLPHASSVQATPGDPSDEYFRSAAVAVLPFEVKGSGLDLWREGMVDLLSTNLDGVAGLRAIDSRTVLARWREGAEDAGASDLGTALDVARGTGARYAVIGSVVSSGSRMRLGAQIYSLQNENSLGSLQVDGPPDSLLALVDRLSIDVLAAIWQGRERPQGQVDLTRITTTSLPALKAFLEGESLLRRAELEGAIAAYERAVAADSTFAFALYHLGLAHLWTPDMTEDDSRLMTESLQRARRHADRLPEREALLLRAALAEQVTAIGLLQEATRRYPDDADAWFLLGKHSFHAGERALITQEECDQALRKAVELDPGFALSYVYLVNNAFIYQPDSARAARLIDAYHRLAPNSSSDQEKRIAFGLAFGDSIRRREALAALETLPPGSLVWLAQDFLDHPRFWAEREAVLKSRPRPGTTPGHLMIFQLYDTYLSQGRAREALATLEDPFMFAGLRAAGYYGIHSAGLPVPEPTLDQALAPPPTDDLLPDIGSLLIAFYAGAYAADQKRWEDHRAAVARLRSYTDRLLAEGDSSGSRFTRGAALALEGQGLRRRGEVRRALPLLLDGQRLAAWGELVPHEALNETIRWWLGELLLEMERPQDARLYFESFWNDPLAADRLGPIYEQIGDLAKARQAYALVAFAWEDADPELQPRAREARAAVQRLTSAIR